MREGIDLPSNAEDSKSQPTSTLVNCAHRPPPGSSLSENEPEEEEDEDDDDDDYEGWISDEEDRTPPSRCLFCTELKAYASDSIAHMTEHHDFDILEHTRRAGLDVYAAIKWVNLIRRRGKVGVRVLIFPTDWIHS